MLIPINEVKEIERIKDFETRIYEAAKLYAEQGFYVIPLRPNSKIPPQKKTGFNYSSASCNPKTMEKWFGPGGRWVGWNIGLVCGRERGIFAIDLDRHGRADGVENWEELDTGLECPVQATPTGGQHLITQWKENLLSSSGKLAPGIDTRGGDGMARSHIVVWPSRTPDGEYRWIHGGAVPEAPQWVTEKMGVPWTHKPGRGNEEVGEKDEEQKYDLAHIAAMLDHVDPDVLSYEEWLFVGQAINSQHPNKQGLNIWDEWSSRGERYEKGECEKRWHGFNPAGPIRIGSLIYFAKQGGYDPSTDPMIRAGDFDELVKRMNEDNAVLLTGGKIRIVHRDKNGDIHILGTRDFSTLMFNRPVTVPNSRKRVTEADIWMAHENRRECVRGMGFFPGEGLWHDGYVNLWRGWGVEPKQGDWSLFRQHVLEIICKGDETVDTFVLDWMADLLQDPMTPKGTALVMHGEEGTGKGTLCHVMGRLIGRKHYKHVTNERHLTGNFNHLLMDALLIFADEVVYGGSRSTAGILKSMVTEKELVCEPKGVDPFMYENRARVAIASNEDWYVPAGPESRRWMVLDVDGSKARDQKYFDRMYDQMENGGYEAMMYDLLERKITSNLSRAVETEALEHQRSIYRATGDAVDQWLDHCIAVEDLGTVDRGEGGWPVDVDRIELYESFCRWLGEKKGLRSKGAAHFYKKVEQHGFIKFRPRVKEGGPRKWRYKTPLPEGAQEES